MSTKIDKEIYLSDSNIQLKQIETNKTNINNNNNEIINLKKHIYKIASNRCELGSSTNLNSGSYIPFMNKIINTVPNNIIFFSNGIVDIKNIEKGSFIKVSITIWVWSSSTQARPWIQLINYNSRKKYAEAISSNEKNYQSLTISNIVIPFEPHTDGIMRLILSVYTNNSETFRINSGSGDELASWMTIEIL